MITETALICCRPLHCICIGNFSGALNIGQDMAYLLQSTVSLNCTCMDIFFRYFECRARYGLFAPVHKVTKVSASTMPSPMTRSLGSAGLRLTRDRSGSQESVSSLSSATSSASRPRVRLGVTALNNSGQVFADLLMLYHCLHFKKKKKETEKMN